MGWLSLLTDLLLPPRCHACHASVPEGEETHLCTSCRSQLLPIVSPLCTQCGIPFRNYGGSDDHLCGSCLKDPPPFTAARTAYAYEGPLRDLIHNLKYSGNVKRRRPLEQLLDRLTDNVLLWEPDCILPVPLHESRLKERGFNQSILLAERAAERWQTPLLRRAMRRTRKTVPQMELDRDDRMTNVKGAFAVADPSLVRKKRVLLLDDVITTGSTVTECARVLRKSGAEEVFVIALARTLQR